MQVLCPDASAGAQSPVMSDSPVSSSNKDTAAASAMPATTETVANTSAGEGGCASGARVASEVDPVLLQKFIGQLRDKGFFAGLSDDSPEYAARLEKARSKFEERCRAAPPPCAPPAVSTPPKSDPHVELRERLAAETKRCPPPLATCGSSGEPILWMDEGSEHLMGTGWRMLSRKRQRETSTSRQSAMQTLFRVTLVQ